MRHFRFRKPARPCTAGAPFGGLCWSCILYILSSIWCSRSARPRLPPMLMLRPELPTPLVSQIVEGLRGVDRRPRDSRPTASCRRSAPSPPPTASASSPWSRPTTGWWRRAAGVARQRRLLRQAAQRGGRRRCARRAARRPALRRTVVPAADLREPQPRSSSRAAAGCRTTGCSRMACAAACASCPPAAPSIGGYGLPFGHMALRMAGGRIALGAPDRGRRRAGAADPGLQPGAGPGGSPAAEAGRSGAGGRPRLSQSDVHAALPGRPAHRRAAHADRLRPRGAGGAAGGAPAEGLLHAAAAAEPDLLGGAAGAARTGCCNSPGARLHAGRERHLRRHGRVDAARRWRAWTSCARSSTSAASRRPSRRTSASAMSSPGPNCSKTWRSSRWSRA